MMREKKEMNEKTKLTFENVPQVTYWRNPNSGVIYHCSIFRNTWVESDEFEDGGYSYDTEKSFVSISSINTRYELGYHYTWDELVEKFEYLCKVSEKNYASSVFYNKHHYFPT